MTLFTGGLLLFNIPGISGNRQGPAPAIRSRILSSPPFSLIVFFIPLPIFIISTFFLVLSGEFKLFPERHGNLKVDLVMPAGAGIKDTNYVIKSLEEKIKSQAPGNIRYYLSYTGTHGENNELYRNERRGYILLTPALELKGNVSPDTFKKDIEFELQGGLRDLYPGARLEVKWEASGPPVGKDFMVTLQANQRSELEKWAVQYDELLKQRTGLINRDKYEGSHIRREFLNRNNGKPALTFGAGINSSRTSAQKEYEYLKLKGADLEEICASCTAKFGQDNNETMDSTQSLFRAVFFIALPLLVLLLGYIIFRWRSFLVIFLPLMALFFSFTGAEIALLIFGQSFSLITIIIVLLVAGVGVLEGLWLLQVSRKMRLEKQDVRTLIQAGNERISLLVSLFVTSLIFVILAFWWGQGASIYSPSAGLALVGALSSLAFMLLFVLPLLIKAESWVLNRKNNK